jgi:hypothetical protein
MMMMMMIYLLVLFAEFGVYLYLLNLIAVTRLKEKYAYFTADSFAS